MQLGHVPDPLHHQVPPPFCNNWKKSERPSRQRGRGRHYAKQKTVNSDVIETSDKEETVKKALQQTNVEKFHELVDNDKFN